jgi:hypothetical protein
MKGGNTWLVVWDAYIGHVPNRPYDCLLALAACNIGVHLTCHNLPRKRC